MSYLHHWKTLLGTRSALKCHCPWRCCPDCVHLVQTALLSSWIEMRAAGCAPAGIGAGSCSVHTWLEHLAGLFVSVWCWELSNTGTGWAFQLETDHPVLLTMVPHHLLGNKTVFHWGMLWNPVTQKNLHGATSSVETLHCTRQKCHVPFQQQAWLLIWVTCRNRGWFGMFNFLIKIILELWADEHFGSFATVSLFPLTSDALSNSLRTALALPVLSSAVCCNHPAEPWLT